MTPLPVPVVSRLVTCAENGCYFMNFVVQSISEGNLMYRGVLPARFCGPINPISCSRSSFSAPSQLPSAGVISLHEASPPVRGRLKSSLFNDSSSKSRRTETFSFVTSIIGKNWRTTSMSSSLCKTGNWLTVTQNFDSTAEAQDITSLTVKLATFIVPLSLLTSVCSKEIFLFKH